MGKSRFTVKMFDEFFAALYEHVQIPGYFMMKKANANYPDRLRVETLFADAREDIADLFREYLKSDEAVFTDFDLHIAEIVESTAWQSLVTQYIEKCKEFTPPNFHMLKGEVYCPDSSDSNSKKTHRP